MLMLKNEVKDLFKKAKLDDFTVGRDNSGYLNIVGPCGKPLVPITNFSIGAKLTKAEREICIDDHIKPVLAAHTKTILDLIDAKESEAILLDASNVIIKTAKDDGYLIGFTVESRYGSEPKDKDTYSGSVSFREKTDDTNVYAKIMQNTKFF